MVQTPTPTVSRILFGGALAFFLLNHFAAESSLAQSGLFRSPSLNNEAPSSASKTDRLVSNSTGTPSPHLPSHNRLELGVKQTGQQDPIEDWMSKQEQESPAEELPAGDSKSVEDQTEANWPDDTPTNNSDGEQPTRSNREVIVQRYSDGKPQIEREVMQDEEGNYLNDGFWRVYSQQGQRVILAQGQYRRGVMAGTWMRKHAKNSSGLFSTRPFSMFEGPFTSIATFENSKLDGLWTLLDSANQKMFEVPYQNGKRHGTASWWYPSQTKMREVTFFEGVISGRLREWDEQKKLVRDEEYINGQRLIRNVTYYRPQQIEAENYFLDAKLELEGEDDWWRAEPAKMVPQGSRVQHGPVAFWYENGMPKLKGNYDQGKPVGRFTGWHPNGNKRMEGSFEAGKKEGLWRWWHPNGQKASEGNYKADQPDGPWTWWNEQGKVEDEKKLDGTSLTPTTESSNQSSAEQSSAEQSSAENSEQLPDGLIGPGKEINDSTEKANPTQSKDPQSIMTLDIDGLNPQQSTETPEPANSSTEPEEIELLPESSGSGQVGQMPAAASRSPEVKEMSGSFQELMESYGKQK